VHPLALAPVVGRVGLARIGGDLGLGERSGQALALLVEREPRIRLRGPEVAVDPAGEVALTVTAVLPVAVRAARASAVP